MKILQNPLIKITGVMVILYFGLFSNKNNPESLGNRLSAEKIKKNFSEMQDKGKFIATNISAARSYAKQQEDEKRNNNQTNLQPIITEVNLGFGATEISCGMEIIAVIDLSNEAGKNLISKNQEKILIGSKKDWLIEKNIIGMKKHGIKRIKIPQGFVTDNQELAQLLQDSNSSLTYQIFVQDIINSSAKTGLNCQ
ncbi:MAG: hypothetical protein SFV53_06430 [Rickettsiales bacterium]|nr:hypothetical protein [Rickettsiales bacterium]